MPDSEYTHVRTAAYVLRPGMPAFFHAPTFRKTWKDSGDVDGIVTKVVKTSPTRLRIFLTDRYSGRLRVRGVDHRHAVYLHKGFMRERGIKLGAAELDREAFLAADKGTEF